MQEDGNSTELETGKEPVAPSKGPEPEATEGRMEFLAEPAAEAPEVTPVVDLNERIAERIRTDCREHGILTSEEAVVGLLPGAQHDKISAALAEMAKNPDYKDIKAVTTASGLVFFYSERHIKVAEAAAKSLLEEVKFRIGERVRSDSRETEILTPVDALYEEIGWEKSAYGPEELQKDPRYEDIKTITASTGKIFFYSDRHMGRGYAVVLARVAGNDPCATIAETVRDESRIYPRPTCVLLFLEKLFGINENDLKTIVEKTLARPDYSDIKMMVHPATGGVYLYSEKHLDGNSAWSMMDWEEVGRDANP